MIEEMGGEEANLLALRYDAEGRSVERLGWERQQRLQQVLAESSWERWSGMVDGPDAGAFLSGGIHVGAAVSLIGCTTLVISALGVKLGSLFGDKLEKKAEILGGVILILLGIKILLEHLGVL